MQNSSEKRHLALDGIRGLAIACIFLHHSVTHPLSGAVRSTGEGLWGGFVAELRLSLICFFVLSGFLLYGGFARALRERSGLRLGEYARRRAARVFPAYYLALLGSIVLLWGAQMPNLKMPSLGELPLFAVLGQNYSRATLEALDGPTWTLCIEAAFYLVLPLLALVLWRLRAGPRLQLTALAALFALGIAWRVPALGAHGPIGAKALPAFLPYFVIGMALALWNQHRARARTLSPAATVALLGAAAAVVVLDGVWHFTSTGGEHGVLGIVGDIPAAAGFALLLAATLVGSGRAIGWLSWRPLVGLGVISYSFYLWHLPLMLFWRRLGLEGGWVETAGLTFVATLTIATVSWKLIEAPILRWAHRSAPERSGEGARRDRRRLEPSRRPRPVSVTELT